MNAPHTPEFSTTRSFPGVLEEESFAMALFRILGVSASGWGTPPMTPLTEGNWEPLISLGRRDIVRSTEGRSILSEGKWAYHVYMLYRNCILVQPRRLGLPTVTVCKLRTYGLLIYENASYRDTVRDLNLGYSYTTGLPVVSL